MRASRALWIRFISLCLMAAFAGLLAACGGGGGGSPAPAAAILAQPTDTHVEGGATATFSVQATAGGQYQWQRHAAGTGANDWQAIEGATGAQYTTSAITNANDGDQYRVIVTWPGGASHISSIATLTVDPAPVAPSITVQPADASAIEGQPATFSVTATGTSVGYRWQQSRDGTTWTDSVGGNAATLTFTPASGDDGLQFHVLVSNTLGTVTSAVAHLGVQPVPEAPVFTTSPQAASVLAGQAATFSAQAFGTPAPDIAWQVSPDNATWSAIPGATSGSYTLAAATLQDDGHWYRAVASNTAGTVASPGALLSVAPLPAAPVVTTAPADTSVGEGGNATFSVVVTGQPAPTLQWQVSTDAGATFGNINGAVAGSLVVTGATRSQDGSRYRVVATNSLGSATSTAATLSVVALPSFTLQPAEVAWRPGAIPAYFLAAVDGADVRLQWQASRDAGATWNPIAGATGTSLVLTSAADADIGQVRLAATNGGGTTTSWVANLSIIHSTPVSGTVTSTRLLGVRWTGATTAVAAGDLGTMLRSTDSGATWSITAQIQSTSPTSLAVHGQTAIALGFDWNVMRSIDAGAHWFSGGWISVAGSPHGVAFSGTTATAVGDYGAIERSADGGASWRPVSSGVTGTLDGVAFNASGVGIIVGESGDLLRSVDGGATWAAVATGQSSLHDVAFVNASTAVAVGDSGVVLRSTDAGLTWHAIATGSQLQLIHVAFDGAGNGSALSGPWISDRLHTSDGGMTWTLVHGTRPAEAVDYAPVGTAATAIAVGAGGSLETSADGGLVWTTRTRSAHPLLRGIAFASATVGTAVGESGTILRSTDGGDSWAAIATPSTAVTMYDIAFPSPQIGIAVGAGGTIWRSADGGATWNAVRTSGTDLDSVRFTSATHGVAVGSGAIVYTDDAGLSWRTASTGGQPKVQAVAFGTSLLGVAVGDGFPVGGWGFANGAISRTTDGGLTWTAITPPYSIDLVSVGFADANTVVALGFNGALRSTDGGLTWSSLRTIGGGSTPIVFDGTGAGTAGMDTGFLARTQDSGATWSSGEYITGDSLVGLASPVPGKVFVTTTGGAIYRYDAP